MTTQNNPKQIYLKTLMVAATLCTFLILSCQAILEQSPEIPHMYYTPSVPAPSGHLAPWMRRTIQQHQQQADVWDRYEMTSICATTCLSLQELYLYTQANTQAAPQDMVPLRLRKHTVLLHSAMEPHTGSKRKIVH